MRELRESPQRVEEESERAEPPSMVQVLRRAYGGPGGVACLAPSGGSMGLHRHRFGTAGALDRVRLVDRPVRRVGPSCLPRLSRQGVSLDAQGAGRRDTARCHAWTRPDLGRNSHLLERHQRVIHVLKPPSPCTKPAGGRAASVVA